MKIHFFKRAATLLTGLLLLSHGSTGICGEMPDANALVRRAFNHVRGDASVARVEMTVHRPTWERTVSIHAWTLGEEKSLITILAPAKDKGNATLKRGNTMWIYNPKVNRVIKLPPSMMSQSWMGSDFSNNDLAKSDTLIREYNHEITGVLPGDGIRIFRVKSTPLEFAPVVWGGQELDIREDGIMVKQQFFDEEMRLVKTMTLDRIKPMSGRLFPTRLTMAKAGRTDEYTLVEYNDVTFKESLPQDLFTLSGLKKAGR
ncbi:MAG: outer membrane lipoprotein-sorting protein [Desulfobacteraceae bacterium]|nr:outer membrane lipoprotein-sorting protein [Desulfobacteraceae bacterium]